MGHGVETYKNVQLQVHNNIRLPQVQYRSLLNVALWSLGLPVNTILGSDSSLVRIQKDPETILLTLKELTIYCRHPAILDPPEFRKSPQSLDS